MKVLHIAVELPRPGRPNTMAPAARQIESLRRLGVDIEVLEVVGLAKLKYLQALPKLYRALRRVDLVHAHYAFCGWLGRLQLSKPLVVSFMGSDLYGSLDKNGRPSPASRFAVEIDRRFARFVDEIIVKSPEMARVLEPLPVHVIPNGVDTETFRHVPREEALRALGWGAGPLRVLFPGDPATSRKRFPLARAAVEAASRRVGRPIEIAPLCRIDPSQVPLMMNACDAMILTSFAEGSPNVVKEAMACNLPIVSVPVGDVAEMLEGVEGTWIRPDNVDDLAAALLQAIATPASRGREALLRKGLDIETVARRILSVYDRVLERSPSRRGKRAVFPSRL